MVLGTWPTQYGNGQGNSISITLMLTRLLSARKSLENQCQCQSVPDGDWNAPLIHSWFIHPDILSHKLPIKPTLYSRCVFLYIWMYMQLLFLFCLICSLHKPCIINDFCVQSAFQFWQQKEITGFAIQIKFILGESVNKSSVIQYWMSQFCSLANGTIFLCVC